jgi:hypothetical protein
MGGKAPRRDARRGEPSAELVNPAAVRPGACHSLSDPINDREDVAIANGVVQAPQIPLRRSANGCIQSLHHHARPVLPIVTGAGVVSENPTIAPGAHFSSPLMTHPSSGNDAFSGLSAPSAPRCSETCS